MYTFSATVRYSECDATSTIMLGSLVNYLQDTSTFHSESLGHGVCYMAQEHFAWFITAWRIRIERLPRYLERITCGTWVPSIHAASVNRNFSVTGEDGSLIVVADSLWACYDTALMRPVRIPKDERDVYDTDDAPVDLAPIERKLRLFGEGERLDALRVAPYHLDSNNHMNNARYVSLASSFVSARDKGFVPHELLVQYRRAAQLNDTLIPYLYVEEGGYAVNITGTDGTSFAVVRMRSR